MLETACASMLVALVSGALRRRAATYAPRAPIPLFDQPSAGRDAAEADAVKATMRDIWMYHPHERAARHLHCAASEIAAHCHDIAETRLERLAALGMSSPKGNRAVATKVLRVVAPASRRLSGMSFHRNCVVAPASRRLSGMSFHRNCVVAPASRRGSGMSFHRNCVVTPASRRWSGMSFHRNFVVPETGAGGVGRLAGSHLVFAARLAIARFRRQRDPRDSIRPSRGPRISAPSAPSTGSR
ncbi:MAG: hypothetical protein U1F52_18995 [Burkholderiales bacterium]